MPVGPGFAGRSSGASTSGGGVGSGGKSPTSNVFVAGIVTSFKVKSTTSWTAPPPVLYPLLGERKIANTGDGVTQLPWGCRLALMRNEKESCLHCSAGRPAA